MRDLFEVNSQTCLLHPSTRNFIHVSEEALEGCYIFHDQERGTWVRAGKAVGSALSNPRAGLVQREKGHRMAAEKSTPNDKNKFYLTYPTRHNKNRLKKARYYEDLQQFVGMAFDRDKDLSGLTDKNEIFFWTDEVLERVEKMNEGNCKTLQEKQLVIIGYFFELCYDICLSSAENVSQNPGFESRLHIFDNAERSL